MSNSIEYVRRLYDDVLSWYQSADGKAQVVLAIDGALVAFMTGAMFSEPNELKAIVGKFSGLTWLCLALMTVSLLGSVVSAIVCLWSRVYSSRKLEEFIEAAQREKGALPHYAPKTLWFFQMVASLEESRFQASLKGVVEDVEMEVMASQIQILSRNVRTKHRAVNVGFVLAAATLILFFFAGLSYLVRSTA